MSVLSKFSKEYAVEYGQAVVSSERSDPKQPTLQATPKTRETITDNEIDNCVRRVGRYTCKSHCRPRRLLDHYIQINHS